MIEPGPVHTEFETKMMADVAKMEYPGADADTVRYFKDVYLPSSVDIFEGMGQTPDDIAKVREPFSSSHFAKFLDSTNSVVFNEMSQNFILFIISVVHQEGY